jgi:hypothetical protein
MALAVEILPRLLAEHRAPERLEVCFEVCETDDPEFRPGSLVPAGAWMPAQEAGELAEPPWASFGDATLAHNVALIRFPRAVLQGHLLSDARWEDSEARRADLRACIDELCRSLSSAPESLQHRGTFRGVPGSASPHTTRHPADRRLVGLHVDGLVEELESMEQPLSRLSVNLGPAARYFVFLPAPISEVLESAGRSPRDKLYSADFHRWLRGRPSVVACRIRLEPAEAYIAPTHLLLHDGQSLAAQGERLYTVAGPFDQTEPARLLSVV